MHFGHFEEMTMAPAEGLTVLVGPNESGKSTLLDAIQLAFYGTSKKGSDPRENIRKRYIGDPTFAPEVLITFEKDGVDYRLYRRLGDTNSKDRIQLVDQLTGAEQNLAAQESIGDWAFGINADAFKRSVFIGATGALLPKVAGKGGDQLLTRLLNAEATGEETVDANVVGALLLKEERAYLNGNKTGGLLFDTRRQIAQLEEEETRAVAAEEARAAEGDDIKAQKARVEEAQKRLDQKEARRARLQKNMDFVYLQETMQDRKQLDALSLELDQANQSRSRHGILWDHARFAEAKRILDDWKTLAAASEIPEDALPALMDERAEADRGHHEAEEELAQQTAEQKALNEQKERLEARLRAHTVAQLQKEERGAWAEGELKSIEVEKTVALEGVDQERQALPGRLIGLLMLIGFLALGVGVWQQIFPISFFGGLCVLGGLLFYLRFQYIRRAEEKRQTTERERIIARAEAARRRVESQVVDVEEPAAEATVLRQEKERLDIALDSGRVRMEALQLRLAQMEAELRRLDQERDRLVQLEEKRKIRQEKIEALARRAEDLWQAPLVSVGAFVQALEELEPAIREAEKLEWAVSAQKKRLESNPHFAGETLEVLEQALGNVEQTDVDPEAVRAELDVLEQEIRKDREATAELLREVLEREATWKNRYRSVRLVDTIRRELDGFRALLSRQEGEYQAIGLAREALLGAMAKAQKSFSPKLNERSSAIFKRLSGNTVGRLRADTSFSLSLEDQSHVVRDWATLSTGTMEQAYFALRIALSEMAPDVPLFIDDAFAFYDDERAERGLAFLGDFAQEEHRQIIFVTSHARFSGWAKKYGNEWIEWKGKQ